MMLNPLRKWSMLLLALGSAIATAAPSEPAGINFVTRHTGIFNGQTINYTATVGETILLDDAGQPALRLVTTAYTKDTRDTARPILFVFNGGPSTSSATLHMLALGPKRLAVPQDPQAPLVEPPRLVDNTSTVLDAADLVFIDPAEAGFSRVLPAGRRADFYSTDGDARSITRFVQQWVRTGGRERSPRYVLGESYGTIRAALMAGALADSMPLDGVILFGQAVNMIETSQRAKNAVAYATNLPALAAIAAYHGRADRRGRSMAEFIDHAYRWGMNEYLSALIAGRALPASAQHRIARRLQELTGVGTEYYLAHDLVITKIEFTRELLKDRNLVLGQYDARYTGPAPAATERGIDPFARIMQPIVPMLRKYMSESLSVQLPTTEYRDAAPETAGWTWQPTGGSGGPFLDYNYQSDLSKAFVANPRFRLMIGTGIYDLTTTVGPARYLVAKSNYPADRVFQRHYEGGHMAYTDEPTLAAFTSDIRAFVTGQSPASQ